MRLYFPVDLTGNLIMIEKLVLGGIWTEDLPILNPNALTSAPSKTSYCNSIIIDSLNVCVGFVNPLRTVTKLQENQEKFHGFSTFGIIYYLPIFGNFCCITTRQDMV